MKTAAILQARMGASRLPGKMALSIYGETILESVLTRIARVFEAADIYVATTTSKDDDFLADVAKSFGVNVFRGSSTNVLSRYVAIAEGIDHEYICRLTGDSPLNFINLAPVCTNHLKEVDLDYVSTTISDDYPVGVHVEVFKRACLVQKLPEHMDAYSHEHVTPFIYNSSNFRCDALRAQRNFPRARLTLDYLEDFSFLYNLAKFCEKRLSDIQVEDLDMIARVKPEIFDINNHILKSRSISV